MPVGRVPISLAILFLSVLFLLLPESIDCTARSFIVETNHTADDGRNETVGALINTMETGTRANDSKIEQPSSADLSKLHYDSVSLPGRRPHPHDHSDPHHHHHHQQHFYPIQSPPMYYEDSPHHGHPSYPHYHHPHQSVNYHRSNQRHHYRPIVHYEPVNAVHLADASRVLIGEFFNGMGRAFQSIIAPPSVTLPVIENRSASVVRSRIFQRSSEPRFMARAASQLVEKRLLSTGSKEGTGTDKGDNETTPASTSSSPEDIGKRPIDYEQERTRLQENITKRVQHLQSIISTAVEVSRERRDFITRRLLEQTNFRLDQARKRAELILTDPQNAERAVRTLTAVGQGLNSIHAFLSTFLGRINETLAVRVNKPVEKNEPSTIPIEEPKKSP